MFTHDKISPASLSNILIISLFLTGMLLAVPALPYSSNTDHELGVYSLYQYGAYNGSAWKNPVTPSHSEDPAGSFWDIMTEGSRSEFAHDTSKKRVNAQVNINTIFPIPGDGWKDWDQFDLVFFYGHNNMLTPPGPTGSHHFWSNNTGDWATVNGLFPDWGTPALPYEYYWQDVTNARDRSGSVIYLHEPFTSVLLGHHFRSDGLSTYQTTRQDRPEGNSRTHTFRSGLGDNDLEWLILHGCQAVIVSDDEGAGYVRLAANAFKRTFGKWHIILGHYKSYSAIYLTDLDGFAYDLLAGVPIQQAYFRKTDPDNNTSALSAECLPHDVPSSGHLSYIIENGYMNNDTWTDPMPDNHNCRGRRIWYARWIRSSGTYAYDW